MNIRELLHLAELNRQEQNLAEIQTDIDRARKKYFNLSEIQLKLDRRQEARY